MNHDTHLMPSSTFEALKKLRKNGIRLFVATGRPPNNLKVIQDCFEFDGFLTSNGQYCFNHEVVIHEKYIEREDIRNLLPYINKNQIPVLFVEINGNYSNIQNYCLDEAARSLNKEGYPIKAVNEIIESKIIQLMAYIDELANDTLSENEKLEIIRLAISIIEADKNIEYSEVSFFKRIRTQFRTLSDEQILNILPGREIFMLPDNNEDKYDFGDFKFDNIKLSKFM